MEVSLIPVRSLRRTCAIFLAVLWLSLLTLVHAEAQEVAAAPAGFNTTEALIELLRDKGVIDETEAKGFIDRVREKSKGAGQLITITAEGDQEAYLKEISHEAAEKVTEDLNDLKENYEFRSQDLIQKNILLEREVQRLEEVMTEEHLPALQKSAWAQRIRFGGDIRLRHESILFDEDNSDSITDPSNPDRSGGTNVINTTRDKHRQRLRLRFGVKAKIIDQTEENVGKVEAGLRLATGSVGNPVSTNYTLGDDDNSRSDIVLDRAYVKWTYSPIAEVWGGKMPKVTLTGGVMESPWVSSSLIWDSDLAFEGLTANFRTDTLKINPFAGFLTLGYFPIQESDWGTDDKYMLGGQIGFEHRPAYGWEYQVAAAMYNYENITPKAIYESTLSTASKRYIEQMAFKSSQLGNSTFYISQSDTSDETLGLMSEFEILSLSGRLTNSLFFPIQIQLYWDYVKNLAYDSQAMADKIGSTKEDMEAESGDTGYQLGIKAGHLKPRERWEWNLSLEYRYLESDAVLDAYTDSDFHLGGTNAKGWILGGELGIYHNVWLKARWMTSNEIDSMDSTISTTEADLAVDTLQVELNAAF